MTLSYFFSSYIGMYVTQAFCHSIVASVISDQALRAWSVSDPGTRQRFRLIVVLIPVFSFPLFQIFSPGRSSLEFRLGSLFDSNRWIYFEVWEGAPLGLLFLAVLVVTSLIFVLQEMLPILLNAWQARGAEHEGRLREPDPFLESSAGKLSISPPDVVVIDDDDPVIYSSTGRKPSIIVSEGLLEALPPEQLQAALAHELGHIARSRKPVLVLVFVFRTLLFFNPVSLVEFRRTVRNEEKICDDIAVSLTNRPHALAEALKKFFPAPVPAAADPGRHGLLKTGQPLEEYSHAMQLAGRIARLEGAGPKQAGRHYALFAATVLIIALINYFVV